LATADSVQDSIAALGAKEKTMADTIRTRASLETLLADNTTGAISPQDLRDLLATINGAHGVLYASAPGTTPSLTAGVPVMLPGTTTLGDASNVTMPSNMRLQVNPGISMSYHVHAVISLSSSVNGVFVNYYLYKNGVLVPESEQQRKIANGNDVGNMSLYWPMTLADGDYLEIFIESSKVTTLTVETCTFGVQSRIS